MRLFRHVALARFDNGIDYRLPVQRPPAPNYDIALGARMKRMALAYRLGAHDVLLISKPAKRSWCLTTFGMTSASSDRLRGDGSDRDERTSRSR